MHLYFTPATHIPASSEDFFPIIDNDDEFDTTDIIPPYRRKPRVTDEMVLYTDTVLDERIGSVETEWA